MKTGLTPQAQNKLREKLEAAAADPRASAATRRSAARSARNLTVLLAEQKR